MAQPGKLMAGNANSALYYQPSNRFKPTGLVDGMAASFIVAIFLGLAYAFAIGMMPIIYGDLILCGGFGYLVGIMTARLMILRKVRNLRIVRIVAIVSALVGYYTCWVVWVYSILSKWDTTLTPTPLIENPAFLWRAILAINEQGTWSVGTHGMAGGNVNGIMLWVVWVMEATGFLIAAMVGVSRVQMPPYCEVCGAWCRDIGEICTFQPGHSTQIKKALESKDFTVIEQFGPAPRNSRFWNRLDLQMCAGCGATNMVTLVVVGRSGARPVLGRYSSTPTGGSILVRLASLAAGGRRSGKEGETDTSTVFSNLLLNQEQTVAVLESCERMGFPGPKAVIGQVTRSK